MNTEATTELQERISSEFLNREVGPFWAWDSVNQTMIRHWCEVMGIINSHSNCDYTIAPPPMLQVWTMPGYIQQRHPDSDNSNPFAMFELMEEYGYDAIVAVNADQEYFQPVREGDRIYYKSLIENISEEKQTALGTGFFITERGRYFNHRDELVGQTRFRVLKYKPAEKSSANPADKPALPARMSPVRNHDTRFFWDGIDREQLLIQQCSDCKQLRFPPGPTCPHCQSFDWQTIKASGRGTVYSYVVMHHPPIPPFSYPHPVGLIELEEGIRLVAEFSGIPSGKITIGLPVEVCFKKIEDGSTRFFFRPVEAPQTAADNEAATPPLSQMQVGDQLPPLKIPITPKLIAGGAIATRDYQDVHHDYQRARDLGSPNIFMNILTTQGLVYRYLHDRLEPNNVIKALEIKLGAPNFPGDQMLLSGEVKALDTENKILTVGVIGKNQLGNHVEATVTLQLDGNEKNG